MGHAIRGLTAGVVGSRNMQVDSQGRWVTQRRRFRAEWNYPPWRGITPAATALHSLGPNTPSAWTLS